MTQQPSHISPDLSDVFAYIDGQRQEFLDRLIDYVRRPSISAQGTGIGEVASYLAETMLAPAPKQCFHTRQSPNVISGW